MERINSGGAEVRGDGAIKICPQSWCCPNRLNPLSPSTRVPATSSNNLYPDLSPEDACIKH